MDKNRNESNDSLKNLKGKKTVLESKSVEELSKESEVTKEDLEALGPRNLSMDMQEDEILKHRLHPVDFDGKDLDIPGRGADDDQEDIGSEDEENNHYSLGNDDND